MFTYSPLYFNSIRKQFAYVIQAVNIVLGIIYLLCTMHSFSLDNVESVHTESNGFVIPLRVAIKSGDLEQIQFLVQKYPSAVNYKLNYGWSLLHQAAACGFDDVVSFLLSANAELESQTNYGDTPLLLAVRKDNNEKVVKLLIQHGCNLNYRRDADGRTALHEAAYYGQDALVQILLEAGAALDRRDSDDLTAFDIAKGRMEPIEHKGKLTDLQMQKYTKCWKLLGHAGLSEDLSSVNIPEGNQRRLHLRNNRNTQSVNSNVSGVSGYESDNGTCPLDANEERTKLKEPSELTNSHQQTFLPTHADDGGVKQKDSAYYDEGEESQSDVLEKNVEYTQRQNLVCRHNNTKTRAQILVTVDCFGGVFHAEELGVTLLVLAGSFSDRSLKIMIEMSVDTHCPDHCTVVTMTPHGQIFKHPLLLRYPLSNYKDSDRYQLYYRSDAGCSWQPIEFQGPHGHTDKCTLAPTWFVHDRFAYVYLHHFSDHKLCSVPSEPGKKYAGFKISKGIKVKESSLCLHFHIQIFCVESEFAKMLPSAVVKSTEDIGITKVPIDPMRDMELRLMSFVDATERTFINKNVPSHQLATLCGSALGTAITMFHYVPKNIDVAVLAMRQGNVTTTLTSFLVDTTDNEVKNEKGDPPQDGADPTPAIPPLGGCGTLSHRPLLPSALLTDITHSLRTEGLLTSLIQSLEIPRHNGRVVHAEEVMMYMQCGTLTDDKMKKWRGFLMHFKQLQMPPEWLAELEQLISHYYSVDDPQMMQYARLCVHGYPVGVTLGLDFVRCQQIQKDFSDTVTCNLTIFTEARQQYFRLKGFSLKSLTSFHQQLIDSFKKNDNGNIASLIQPYQFMY